MECLFALYAKHVDICRRTPVGTGSPLRNGGHTRATNSDGGEGGLIRKETILGFFLPNSDRTTNLIQLL